MIKKINLELLEECMKDNIDLSKIEELLKAGADPSGIVDFDSTVYNEVVDKFIDSEDEKFLKITELFLKYGMDFTIYNDDNDFINPLWVLGMDTSEIGFKVLKLLLDNNLDVDSAGECWSHELLDSGPLGYTLETEGQYKYFYTIIKKIMLFASYPHIILNDKSLQDYIWFSDNNYDYTKFRNWNNYLIEADTSSCLNKKPVWYGAKVIISEKTTRKKVWNFVFGIRKDDFEEEIPGRM